MSVAVATVDGSQPYLTISKGAVPSIVAICNSVRNANGIQTLDDAGRAALLTQLEHHAAEGLRVLGVASRETADAVATESAMTFEGLLLFEDPTKPDIVETLRELHSLGVRLKIVTGDNHLTAQHVAHAVGLDAQHILTGEQLTTLRDEALWHLVQTTDVFAEADPNQKESIILALIVLGANRRWGSKGNTVEFTHRKRQLQADDSANRKQLGHTARPRDLPAVAGGAGSPTGHR